MRVDSLRADEQAPHLPMPVKCEHPNHLERGMAQCMECGCQMPVVKCSSCLTADLTPLIAERLKIEARAASIFTGTNWSGEP